MATNYVKGLIGLIVGVGPQALMAQTVPNFGNYRDLRGAFRVGIEAQNPITAQVQSASFDQNTIEDIGDFLDPSVIATVTGPITANQGRISQVFDLRGATALAGYAQASRTLTINFVLPNGQTINQANGSPCSFAFTGISRQDSFDIFDAATDEDDTPTSRALLSCASRAFTRSAPADPLAGNPGSLQSSLVRSALDLTASDSLVDEAANTAGDPWVVGAVYTTGSAGRFDIDRVDARIQRSFRVFEGNRAQLKFDLPFAYTRVTGTKAYSAQLGLGLELPLQAQRWSLEPRIAYGIVYSKDAGSVGHIVQGSITSRYAIQGLGRGRLIIGNMIGYSQTLNPPGSAASLNPDLKNFVLRNGLAYDLPLKSRISGRLTSLRASYAFTAFTGDKLRNNSFHEATLSFGVRGREDSPRATRDLIRFNLNTVQAKGYKTYTAGLGFRF